MQTEITAEQLTAAETMSLDKLRQLAVDDMNGVPEIKKEPVRDVKTGKFIVDPNAEQIDNSTDPVIDPAVEATMDVTGIPEEEPEVHIARQEIDNGDGSGVDVYEAEGATEVEAYKNLAAKIAEGKANANKKIRELNNQVKTQTKDEKQSQADLEYIIQQRLKTEPAKAIREIIAEEMTKNAKAEVDRKTAEQAAINRSLATQQSFVDSHADYVGNAKNGNLMRDWVLARGHKEFTTDNLNKAYDALKSDGLLELKNAQADDATEATKLETERTAQAQRDATQQRSQRRGSTITSGRTPAKVSTLPSEDEAYKLPMEELIKLANTQLANRG